MALKRVYLSIFWFLLSLRTHKSMKNQNSTDGIHRKWPHNYSVWDQKVISAPFSSLASLKIPCGVFTASTVSNLNPSCIELELELGFDNNSLPNIFWWVLFLFLLREKPGLTKLRTGVWRLKRMFDNLRTDIYYKYIHFHNVNWFHIFQAGFHLSLSFMETGMEPRLRRS